MHDSSSEYISLKKIFFFILLFPFVLVATTVFVDNLSNGGILANAYDMSVFLFVLVIILSFVLSVIAVTKAKGFGSILFNIFQAICDFLFSIAYSVGNRTISIIIVIVFTVITSLVKYRASKKSAEDASESIAEESTLF